MQSAKIKSAVEGAVAFVDQMDPADKVYIVTFANVVTELPVAGSVGQAGEQLKFSLRGLYAEGVYSAPRGCDLRRGPRRTVKSPDGKNEIDGGPSENDMLSRLPSGTEASSVKIYAIAYGDDADMDVLATLANRTNGKQFTGDVEDIEAVYFLISSEF